MRAGGHEQAHIRETRAPVLQVRDAKDARLQLLAGRVQRTGKSSVVADLASAGARCTDPRNFG